MRLEELLSTPVRLRHVYVAAAIAMSGSVRDASEQLYLTQPATSRSLRELEDALGVQLFERAAKGMTPTSAGEALLPHLRLIASEISALMRHAEEITTGTGGTVRVGTVLAGSARLLPDAVLDLKQADPTINVAIVDGTPNALHDQLLLGQLDVVVGRTLPIGTYPGVAVEVLHQDSVAVVARADHGYPATVTLPDLLDQPWVLPPAETSLRQQVDGAFLRAAGRTPGDVVECVPPVPTKRMLTKGHRLGVVPAGVFADELARGELVQLPVDVEGTAVPIGIITRAAGDLPPTAARLVSALRENSGRLFGR